MAVVRLRTRRDRAHEGGVERLRSAVLEAHDGTARAGVAARRALGSGAVVSVGLGVRDGRPGPVRRRNRAPAARTADGRRRPGAVHPAFLRICRRTATRSWRIGRSWRASSVSSRGSLRDHARAGGSGRGLPPPERVAAYGTSSIQRSVPTLAGAVRDRAQAEAAAAQAAPGQSEPAVTPRPDAARRRAPTKPKPPSRLKGAISAGRKVEPTTWPYATAWSVAPPCDWAQRLAARPHRDARRPDRGAVRANGASWGTKASRAPVRRRPTSTAR